MPTAATFLESRTRDHNKKARSERSTNPINADIPRSKVRAPVVSESRSNNRDEEGVCDIAVTIVAAKATVQILRKNRKVAWCLAKATDRKA